MDQCCSNDRLGLWPSSYTGTALHRNVSKAERTTGTVHVICSSKSCSRLFSVPTYSHTLNKKKIRLCTGWKASPENHTDSDVTGAKVESLASSGWSFLLCLSLEHVNRIDWVEPGCELWLQSRLWPALSDVLTFPCGCLPISLCWSDSKGRRRLMGLRRAFSATRIRISDLCASALLWFSIWYQQRQRD